jgi:hypothetical protein
VAYPIVDCDDTDADVFPGHAELCDGKDNDCDGNIDEGFPAGVDDDNDGYTFIAGCTNPGNDCNDNDPAIFPGSPEVCDGQDNNCNLSTDEGLDVDMDADGVALGTGCLLPGNDCDDADPLIFPGNPEVCDWKDNDCNLVADDGLDLDADGDGYASGPGCFLPGMDCDDTDPDVFPGNLEVCDGKDNDCDGQIDQAPACEQPLPATSPTGFVVLAMLITAAGLLLGLRRAEEV